MYYYDCIITVVERPQKELIQLEIEEASALFNSRKWSGATNPTPMPTTSLNTFKQNFEIAIFSTW